MLTRLWQRLGEKFSYRRTGNVEFREITTDGDRVKVVIALEQIKATITLRLSPESAWLVGNKLIDEAHIASAERAEESA